MARLPGGRAELGGKTAPGAVQPGLHGAHLDPEAHGSRLLVEFRPHAQLNRFAFMPRQLRDRRAQLGHPLFGVQLAKHRVGRVGGRRALGQVRADPGQRGLVTPARPAAVLRQAPRDAQQPGQRGVPVNDDAVNRKR
jgi:hypothetical protein